jgi:prepilin-type N-terminal cleavage/methylation domain-containing protein
VRAFSRNSELATRRGLTLIELLVTIVIMVTVLAGVIPLMSPNNNARKIREASRQLSSMLAQAQAQAARDGRPAGVAFREFGTTGGFSGMALEAFMIAEPPPFAGFSRDSRVVVTIPPSGGPTTYGPNGNGGKLFLPKYKDYDLFLLTFVMGSDATLPTNSPDFLPPGTFGFGDIIEVDNRLFMVIDDERDSDDPNVAEELNGVKRLVSTDSIQCVWIDQTPGTVIPQGTRMYTFRRLPANTSDTPLQFPRGIGIDLQASGATGPDGLEDFDDIPGVADVTGVMFNSNGTLEGVYSNGVRSESVNNVFMLLGAFENGNDGSQDEMDYDFVANPVDDRDELAQRRSRINWLNADSRWVAVNRAGRVVTSGNNIFDPTHTDFTTSFDPTPPSELVQQRRRQINAARLYATQMQTEGGR